MATQYDPIAKDESLNTTEQSPRNIADVLKDELVGIKNAIGGGGGSGGHTIISPDGTSMTQRAGLGFTDAHVSDNSGDDRTDVSLVQGITDANWALLDPTDESNNGFYQIGNSPLLHLGYVGNGEKKDFDAGAQSDYVEVVADGVKNNATLLNELFALVDSDRTNQGSVLIRNGIFHHCIQAESSVVVFTSGYVDTSASDSLMVTATLQASNSKLEVCKLNGTYTNNSSSVPAIGSVFRLYYNDAHTFDFDTKAENCIYDNTSSGLAAADVQSAIDELALKESVYVTGDGSKTYATLLAELYALVDYDKLTNDSYLTVGLDSSTPRSETIYKFFRKVENQEYSFTYFAANGSNSGLNNMKLAPSSSNCLYVGWTYATSGNSVTNATNNIATNGYKITVHY